MDPHISAIATEANKERSRAMSSGHHLRYVLIIGCALVDVLFIAVAAFIKP